jgi:hypothetical protein
MKIRKENGSILFSFFMPTALKVRFAIAVSILCLGYLVLEWYNGRAQMADFRVYYDAAYALMHGETVYGKAFGVSSGFYKYSPFACIPFIPLALLPYAIASVLYFLLITATIIFFSFRVSNCLSLRWNISAQTLTAPIVTGFFLIDHLERELHLGNVNLFLLVLLFESYLALRSHKNYKAGILYGLVLLFKPHFILIFPYLLWKRKIKAIASTLISVGIGILLPTILVGWKTNEYLLAQWFTAMGDHNIALQYSPNTLYGLLNGLLPDAIAGKWMIPAVLSIVALAFVAFMMRNDAKDNTRWSSEIRYTEYFLLIALVPNLVHTDTEHFLWTWPMLALSIHHVVYRKDSSRKMRLILLSVAFIPFALNSPDLVGTRLQLLFDEGGIGIANLLILTASLWGTSNGKIMD